MNVEAATDAAHMLPATTLLAATLVPATLDIREMDTHAMVVCRESNSTLIPIAVLKFI
jgi:hypothetical protein